MTLTPIRWLLLLNALLIAALAGLWVDQTGQLRNSTWLAPVAVVPNTGFTAGPSQPPGQANPMVTMAVLERPLFAPDRRPPPPPAAVVADPMANIRLTGIFTGESAGILALSDGRVRRVKVNETLGPWTLKSVEGRSATFTQGEETRQVDLAYTQLGVASSAVAPTVGTQPGPTTARQAGPVLPSNEDLARENIRRRNEIRAARGIPLLTE